MRRKGGAVALSKLELLIRECEQLDDWIHIIAEHACVFGDYNDGCGTIPDDLQDVEPKWPQFDTRCSMLTNRAVTENRADMEIFLKAQDAIRLAHKNTRNGMPCDWAAMLRPLLPASVLAQQWRSGAWEECNKLYRAERSALPITPQSGLVTMREFFKEKGLRGENATRAIERLEKRIKARDGKLTPVVPGKKAERGRASVAARFDRAYLEKNYSSASGEKGGEKQG